jgi:hypothetical protein
MAAAGLTVAFAGSGARATVLAYEDFNYTPATILNAQNGGTGFSSAWLENNFGTSTDSTRDVITTGSLTFSQLQVSGNAAETHGNYPDDSRTLTTSLGTPGTSVYVSFLLRKNVAGTNPGQLGDDYGGLSLGSLFIGDPGDNDLYSMETTGGGGMQSSSVSSVVGQTGFLVARIDFTAGNDTARLFVNPTVDIEPASANATKTDVNLGSVNVLEILTGSNAVWRLDELRIGTTFADVTPGLTSPGVWLGGAGNWSTAAKWGGSVVPNDAAANAKIDNSNAASSAVTLDQNATVGTLALDAGDSLTINATRTLALAASETSVLSGAVNNAGTLSTQAGTVKLAGGGTHTGQFAISSGATLEFAGGTHNLNSGYSFSGPGALKISAGTVNAGSFNTDGRTTTLTGGTLAVSGVSTVGGATAGTFNHSAGNHSAGTLIVGSTAGVSGTYNLSGTGVVTTTNTIVGSSGNGTFTQTGGTHNVSGTLTIAANAGSSGFYALDSGTLSAATIVNNGTLSYVGGTLNVTDLQLNGSALVKLALGSQRTLRVATVSIAAASKINLTNNKMVVTSTPLGTWDGSTYTNLSGEIKRGMNGGAWNGGGIITNMPDALAFKTTVAIARAGDALALAPGATRIWGGVTVTGNDSLLMYTYAGDLNVDGTINADDYALIDLYSQVEGESGYLHGDINYDGAINADDYALIDANSVSQGNPFPIGELEERPSLVAVPEPAVGAVGALLLPLIRRRRRRI